MKELNSSVFRTDIKIRSAKIHKQTNLVGEIQFNSSQEEVDDSIRIHKVSLGYSIYYKGFRWIFCITQDTRACLQPKDTGCTNCQKQHYFNINHKLKFLISLTSRNKKEKNGIKHKCTTKGIVILKWCTINFMTSFSSKSL